MIRNIDIYFKKLHQDAVMPSYAHEGDVGMDMTAISVEYDTENDMYIYHTGLSFESPDGFGAFLFPRSSNRKTDAYLCNHVGIVDTATYRGEVIFCFKNRTSLKERANMARCDLFFDRLGSNIYGEVAKVYDSIINNPMDYAPYKVGDRIGQMVVMPHPHVSLLEMNELSETSRGEGGFGSTGN